MQIIKSKALAADYIRKQKASGKSIGFVPTMGALHEGHISLIQCAVKDNDITVASIFVNPTQFNKKSDFETYPISLEADFKMLKEAGCDIVFVPSEKEIYPEKDNRQFNFNGLDKFMEGEHRPGHFNGVAQVVTKLFDIVRPTRAYFGQKDFQQLAIIRYITKTYQADLNIEIMSCDIVREPDGLAMSSRNRRLNDELRREASFISEILFKYHNKQNELTAQEIKNQIKKEFSNNKYLELEYFEIVDNISLRPTDKIGNGTATGCIAVHAGDVRLIDNIRF